LTPSELTPGTRTCTRILEDEAAREALLDISGGGRRMLSQLRPLAPGQQQQLLHRHAHAPHSGRPRHLETPAAGTRRNHLLGSYT
jgi:hypothetical protein